MQIEGVVLSGVDVGLFGAHSHSITHIQGTRALVIQGRLFTRIVVAGVVSVLDIARSRVVEVVLDSVGLDSCACG